MTQKVLTLSASGGITEIVDAKQDALGFTPINKAGDSGCGSTGFSDITITNASTAFISLANSTAGVAWQWDAYSNGNLYLSKDWATNPIVIRGSDGGAEFSAGLSALSVQVTSAGGFKSSDNSPGITTTVTTASLVGKTLTIKDGIITGFA